MTIPHCLFRLHPDNTKFVNKHGGYPDTPSVWLGYSCWNFLRIPSNMAGFSSRENEEEVQYSISNYVLKWQRPVQLLPKSPSEHVRFKLIKSRAYSPFQNFKSIYFYSPNRLENYPQFLMLLFLGGLHYPLVTAVAGAVWIAGKVSYSLGYYTGGKCIYSYLRLKLLHTSYLLQSWQILLREWEEHIAT